LLYLINHDSAGKDAAVTVRLPTGTYAMSELIADHPDGKRGRRRVRLDAHLGGRDAQVWSIKPQ
jgi:hypothetical protein